MAKYVCKTPYEVEMYDDYGEHFLGIMKIQKDSIWELCNRPSDYEVLLDNNETGEWIGMGKEEFKDRFSPIA